jgi:putative phosphoesterase
MKVLVLSDIHANLAALEAVAAAESYDTVLCLGDIVGYGPEPGACVRWVRRNAGVVVQGNHDRALADGVAPGCAPHFRWLADATAPIGRQQLTLEEIAWLANRPRWASITLDGVRIMCVHATPTDPLYEYIGPDREAWPRTLASIDADLVVVGHTHLQFELVLGRTRVMNPGSVGQPKDGDPRPAYAVIQDGRVRFGRVRYAVARTVSALEASTASRSAVEQLSALLRTGRVPRRTPPAPNAD